MGTTKMLWKVNIAIMISATSPIKFQLVFKHAWLAPYSCMSQGVELGVLCYHKYRLSETLEWDKILLLRKLQIC